MLDPLGEAWVVDIGLNEFDTRARRARRARVLNRLHLGEIHRDDSALLSDALGGDLRPASWSRTQIDDGLPSFEKPVAAVNLVELKRRARAIILRVCAAHEGVAPVSGEPVF